MTAVKMLQFDCDKLLLLTCAQRVSRMCLARRADLNMNEFYMRGHAGRIDLFLPRSAAECSNAERTFSAE